MKSKQIVMTLLAILFFSSVSTLFGETITLLEKEKPIVKKESRSVSSFTGISVGGAFEIFVKQTGSCSVEVEADAGIIEYIITKVEGNILKIGMKNPPIKCWNNVKEMKVYITVDQLTSLDLSGAVECKTENAIHGENLRLEISGAVEANLNFTYNLLKGEISGATELDVMGAIDKVELKLSGASELDAYDLQVNDMSIYSSGASDAKVSATNILKVSASGACDVKYKGNPSVNIHTSGASDVKKVD